MLISLKNVSNLIGLNLNISSFNEIKKKIECLGLEVDNVIDYGSIFSNYFVIGEVFSCKKHPNADLLNICDVNIGSDVLNIVCGASNVTNGIKVVVALPGAIMPNGSHKISKAKIRGVESNGMICSLSELGFYNKDSDSKYIWVLNKDVKVGNRFSNEILDDDIVVDFSITPNKGYCTSAIGIAREILIALGKDSKSIKSENFFKNINKDLQDNSLSSKIKIKNNCEKDVPYASFSYTKLADKANIESTQKTIVEMHKVGIKSHNAIVDISNYIPSITGVIIHTYDADKLHGKLSIRYAKSTDVFTGLDGSIIDFSKISKKDREQAMLTVDGKENVCSILGIMGSECSKVDEETKNILIECLYSYPESISKSASIVDIKSQALYRAERGVDIKEVKKSLDYCISEINENVGIDKFSKIEFASDIKDSYKNSTFNYSVKHFENVIGEKISKETASNIFTLLGFEFKLLNEENLEYEVTIPTYRFNTRDIFVHQFENDIDFEITEELCRVFGYDKIKEKPISIDHDKKSNEHIRNNSFEFDKICELKSYLSSLGMIEIITNTFVDSVHNFEALNDYSKPIEVLNPIDANKSEIRKSLSSSILSSLIGNNFDSRIESDLLYFEEGSAFSSDDLENKDHLFTISYLIKGRSEKLLSSRSSFLLQTLDKLLYKIFGVSKNFIKYNFSKENKNSSSENSILDNSLDIEISLNEFVFGRLFLIKKSVSDEVLKNSTIIFLECNLSKVLLKSLEFINKKDGSIYKNFNLKKDMSFAFGKSEVKNIFSRNIISDIIMDIDEVLDCRVFDTHIIDEKCASISFEFLLGFDNTPSNEDINSSMKKISKLISQKYKGSLRGEL